MYNSSQVLGAKGFLVKFWENTEARVTTCYIPQCVVLKPLGIRIWRRNRRIPKDPLSIGKLYSKEDLPRPSSSRALHVGLSLDIVEKSKMLQMLKISDAKDLPKRPSTSIFFWIGTTRAHASRERSRVCLHWFQLGSMNRSNLQVLIISAVFEIFHPSQEFSK